MDSSFGETMARKTHGHHECSAYPASARQAKSSMGSPLLPTLLKSKSWKSTQEKIVGGNWCNRAVDKVHGVPTSLSRSASTLSHTTRTRHRQVLADASRWNAAAEKIQHCWQNFSAYRRQARKRFILSVARRLHHQDEGFRRRRQLREDLVMKSSTATPTVWQLLQCRLALKTAIQNVTKAARIVASADLALGDIHGAAKRRKELKQILQKQERKLQGVDAFRGMLKERRGADAHWHGLLQSVQMRRDSECL
eukprot:TRINITY_DN85941_c0_g1_i1.p1 TRINITY_DN85941_c0_g1~~TRINITY_DN85941_c0_g1_i1.p1  ORF type:complete len:252 (-),score=46.21 TRINITY_DN85941_c0_g1_i1:258-1013(-)